MGFGEPGELKSWWESDGRDMVRMVALGKQLEWERLVVGSGSSWGI